VSQRLPWRTESGVERAEQLGIELAERALAQGAERIIAGLLPMVEEQQHV
jgi:ribosomal protein L18